MVKLGFGIVKPFISLRHLFLNPPMPSLHFNPITCMHIIVCLHHVWVHIKKQLVSTNLLHDKHFLAHVAWVPKQIFKVFIYVGKMVMLVSIIIIMSQHGCTTVWLQVFGVSINEKTLVFNNDYVVHWMNLFLSFNQVWCHITPQLANFDKSFVNELNSTFGSLKSPSSKGVCILLWPYMDITMVGFLVFCRYKK